MNAVESRNPSRHSVIGNTICRHFRHRNCWNLSSAAAIRWYVRSVSAALSRMRCGCASPSAVDCGVEPRQLLRMDELPSPQRTASRKASSLKRSSPATRGHFLHRPASLTEASLNIKNYLYVVLVPGMCTQVIDFPDLWYFSRIVPIRGQTLQFYRWTSTIGCRGFHTFDIP